MKKPKTKKTKRAQVKRPPDRKSASDNDIPDTWVLGIGELAAAVNRSERIIFQWSKQGMPSARRAAGGRQNWYDPEEIRRWATINKKIKREENEILDIEGTPAGYSAMLEKYRMERYKREKRLNEIADGKIVDAAEHSQVIKNILISVWSQVQAIPERAAPLLAGKSIIEIKKILIDNLNRCGEQIIETLKRIADE